MKRLLAGLVMAAVLLFAGRAAVAGEQDFVLVNHTGVEIHKIFISTSETDNWEEDVLGDETLPDGRSVKIRFAPEEDAEVWDIKIEDDEGTSIVWTGLILVNINKVTLTLEDGEAKAELE
jgi:hypothetical protein